MTGHESYGLALLSVILPYLSTLAYSLCSVVQFKHMRIYIMRLGQSADNARRLVSGSGQTPLSELGRHQVRLAAENAKHLGIDLIVSSPMQRSVDSAYIVADVLEYPRSSILIIDELRERNQGELEGKSYALDETL